MDASDGGRAAQRQPAARAGARSVPLALGGVIGPVWSRWPSLLRRGALARSGRRGPARLGGRALAWLVGAACLAGLAGPYATGHTAAPAPPGVVRLHVVAHSDDPQDQALKLRVRDAVLPLLAEAVAGARSPEEALGRVEERVAAITARAREAIRAGGYDYPVRVETGRFPFPARRLGDRVYPAGTYHAVRVVIGAGRGHNFWCVLFPGLCWLGDAGPAAREGAQGNVAAAAGPPAAVHTSEAATAAGPARGATGGTAGGAVPAGEPGPAPAVAAGGTAEAAAPPGGAGSGHGPRWAIEGGVAVVDEAATGGVAPRARWFFLDWWRAGVARWRAALGLAVQASATR